MDNNNLITELKNLVAECEQDAFKFFVKGNAVAGTRLRIKMQDIKAKAQQIRIAVNEVRAAKRTDKQRV